MQRFFDELADVIAVFQTQVGGSVLRISSASARTARATSSGFDRDWRMMPRLTMSTRLPLNTVRASSAPRETRATSDR